MSTKSCQLKYNSPVATLQNYVRIKVYNLHVARVKLTALYSSLGDISDFDKILYALSALRTCWTASQNGQVIDEAQIVFFFNYNVL